MTPLPTANQPVHLPEEVLRELALLLRDGQPRTLLFEGAGGTGRLAAAGWLAAYLNCAAASSAPCGTCESCRLAADGAHPDLKIVTPDDRSASGRAKRALQVTIDQVVPRAGGHGEPLGPWLHSRPHYRRRVGVIAHADSMTQGAANSVLKLLEEPPSWGVLVLIAPGREALLPTVASRCAAFRFRPVPREVVGALKGATIDHPAVRLGRPGMLPAAAQSADPDQKSEAEAASEAAREAAEGLLRAVAGELTTLFAACEEFVTATENARDAGAPTGTFEWLRELLRGRLLTSAAVNPAAYAEAVDAVSECEEALMAYANAQLAVSVLALTLRGLLPSP